MLDYPYFNPKHIIVKDEITGANVTKFIGKDEITTPYNESDIIGKDDITTRNDETQIINLLLEYNASVITPNNMGDSPIKTALTQVNECDDCTPSEHMHVLQKAKSIVDSELKRIGSNSIDDIDSLRSEGELKRYYKDALSHVDTVGSLNNEVVLKKGGKKLIKNTSNTRKRKTKKRTWRA